MASRDQAESPLLPSPTNGGGGGGNNNNNTKQIDWWKLLLRPCIAEFVGTTLFVFSGILASFNSGGVVDVALGHAFALFVLISITANASGGHLNPAVTFGVFLSGAIAPGVALGYVVSQLTGGMVGAALTKGLVNLTAVNWKMTAITLNAGDISSGKAIGLETFLTCILVLTVLTVAVDTKGSNNIAPLAIGFAVGSGILAGGNLSGASMNPARSLGPAVAYGFYSDLYVYFVGPPLGGILAALIYRFVLSSRRLPIPIYSSFKRGKDAL